MNEQLTALMKERTDGNWEFLATAAGHESSVSRTVENLTIETLYSSSFTSPGTIQRRVDALAALDVVQVVLLAEHWPRLGEFLGNGSTEGLAGFLEAWKAALRFLPDQLQRDVLQTVVPTALEEEKTALLSSVPDFRTWDEVAVFVENAENYADLRMTDRATFPDDQVPEGCVEALLDVPLAGRWGPFESLRVLRSVARLLEDKARTRVLDLAGVAWTEFSGDHTGQLILLELARSIDAEGWAIELATAHLVKALRAAMDPLPFLHSAYVVADTGWMVP